MNVNVLVEMYGRVIENVYVYEKESEAEIHYNEFFADINVAHDFIEDYVEAVQDEAVLYWFATEVK